MGAAIGIGLAAMGNAFMKSYNDTTERNRRQEIEDEDRAWKKEEREAARADRAANKKLDTEMRDALAPRVTMAGTVTQGSDGKLFSASTENAAEMQQTLANEAELRGESAPTQEPGVAVTGRMTQGHQIATGGPAVTMTGAAVKPGVAVTGRMTQGHQIATGGPAVTMTGAAVNPNDPAARDERALQVLRANGQWKEAMAMETAIMDQKAKRIGLESDEFKFLDEKANREMMEHLQGGKNWWEGAAKFITNTKAGPLKDIKAEAKLSKDGKTVEMFAVMPDGSKQPTGTYPANYQGLEQFIQKFGSIPLEVRLRLLSENRKAAQDQLESQSKNNLYEAQAGYYKAAAGVKDAETKEDAKIPAAVKLEASSLAKQIEDISAALNKSMAEGSFDANNPGTKLLLEQQSALRIQYRRVITPYKPGAGASADPLGLNKPPPAAVPGQQAQAAPAATTASSTRVTPQMQASRDRDRLAILQSELAAAQKRLAGGDPRAQGDVQALQAELGRMSATQPAMVKGLTPAKATPQAAPMAQAAAAPAQASAPVAPTAATMQAARPAPPSVAQVLAGPSASPEMVAIFQKRASAIEAAASEVKVAQADVVSAAKAGNQAGVKQAMDKAAAAGDRLRQMLSSMNQQQAAIVMKAVGL
jgi:hypothetical protein